MTPTEYLDMAYELLARASICLNYSVGTTKPLLVSELENANKSLATAKKEISILTERLEKANKLAEDDRVKAAATLLESKNEVKRLQQFVDSLTLSLQQSSSQVKQITEERDFALADRDRLTSEYSALEDEICEERQRGFEQGIAQCHYFFQTPLEHDGFNIMKIFVDGQLVDISAPPPSRVESNTDQAIP